MPMRVVRRGGKVYVEGRVLIAEAERRCEKCRWFLSRGVFLEGEMGECYAVRFKRGNHLHLTLTVLAKGTCADRTLYSLDDDFKLKDDT